MVEFPCKTPTARVYEITAVREALPKRMPEVACAGQSSESRRRPWLCSMGFNSPLFAGSNPAVRWKTYRQWIGFVLRDAKNGTRKSAFVCENVFSESYYHSGTDWKAPLSCRSHVKAALPESGYRVFPNGAKRLLSAP